MHSYITQFSFNMVKSGQNSFLLIVIISLPICLLEAKSLVITRQSPIINQGNKKQYDLEDTALNEVVPCLPSKNQMDHYNRLNLDGKLYYALKAVEAEKNRTKATIIAEDNVLIANISDQSRFTPAGMDTANKVVCAKLLQEMDAEASLFSSTALCAWDYICDYKADRFPNYLFKARCKTARCNGDCNKDKHNMCQSHGIHVTVLQMRGNCEEWVWGQELLPIACTCTTVSLA